ncbi:MAG: hypothetical protein IIC78_11075 [Chloroflexi bacterium]|nr:hypothetical protein [Chloroflexota bacterium]
MNSPPVADQSIAVYLVGQHPLEIPGDRAAFRWLHTNNGFLHELHELIGPFDPDKLKIIRDEFPAGPQWHTLIESVINGKIGYVVTHLAPLTSGQRQLLIGVCAHSGARLITPGDGGRNAMPANT